MVAVQVGNKDVVQTREFELLLSKLQLRSFGTINHKEFVAHIKHLRGGIVARCGQSTATAEDVKVKFLHSLFLLSTS